MLCVCVCETLIVFDFQLFHNVNNVALTCQSTAELPILE